MSQTPPPGSSPAPPPAEPRLRRLGYRAWHRGTREADFLIGGFFDRFHTGWTSADAEWFEALLDEDDVVVMAWALGAKAPPERFAGPLMDAMQRLDYIHVHR